jgi:general secretion pathway protein M
MNLTAILRKSVTNSPTAAAAAYIGLVLVLLAIIVSSIVDIFDQRAAVAASAAMLEQLEGRKAPPGGRSADPGMPAGSAFLEGATVTVAGAALLQRVAGAVTKLGGNVLSSQLDVQGTQSKAGFVSMIANCELDQPALQPLVYDLEAGMPFLFIDQLTVQSPTTSSGEGRLRILLAVSAQWQGTK